MALVWPYPEPQPLFPAAGPWGTMQAGIYLHLKWMVIMTASRAAQVRKEKK